MDNTYKLFDQVRDISANSKQIVTVNAFSNVDTDGDLAGYHTSSTQYAASSSHYYLNVYDSDPTASQALVQFDLAYGNINGYNSASNNAYEVSYDPAKANYYQFRNMLLPVGTNAFEFANNDTGSGEIYIIAFKRNRIKQEIDPGN